MIAEIAATGAAFLVAGGAHYAARWPESQIFGRTIVAGRNPSEWALTYDDGPNDIHTGHLLELFARYNVRATFFMMGSRVRLRPQIAREVAAAGHCIGNHTVSHPKLVYTSPQKTWAELAECNAILADTLGIQPKLFRPPYGARRPDTLRIARKLGLTPVMWNIMANDWQVFDAQQQLLLIEQGIARNTLRQRGSNVLLHDGDNTTLGADRSYTVKSTELLLKKYAGEDANGSIRFVTPLEWL